MRFSKDIFVLMLMAFSATHCGTEQSRSTASGEEDAVAASDSREDIVMPPQGYYDEVMRYELSLIDQGASAAAARPVLYLNFSGGQVARGYGLDQSFIVCKKVATVPASGFSPSEQDAIVQRVQDFYAAAGSSLLVTKTRPAQRPFTTMMVGGSMGSLGCRESRGVLGIAPLDAGNTNKNDVGFAFTKYEDSLRVTAETIAHEAGHTFGLDHVQESKGLMYYANSPNIVGFIVGTIRKNRKQDEPAILQRDVGKLDATVASNDAVVADQATEGDDTTQVSTSDCNDRAPVARSGKLLANLLALLNGASGTPPTTQNNGTLVSLLTPIFSGLLGGGSLSNLGAIGSLNGVDTWIKLLSSLQGAGGSNSTVNSGVANAPDFVSLLELNDVGDLQALLRSLAASKAALASYPPEQQRLLATVVKLSHAQAYQKMRAN